MYDTILVTLDATPTDRLIIEHIKQLAKLHQSKVVLMHVATGVPAMWRGPDAGGEEVEEDSAYLAQVKSEFAEAGIPAETHLAFGKPSREIINWANAHPCDLIAMSTHGHQFIGDMILGKTASSVQHHVSVPVLLLRAK